MLAKLWYYCFNKQRNSKGSIVCKLVCREESQLTMMSVQLLSVDLNISARKQLGNLRASTPVVEIAFFFAL